MGFLNKTSPTKQFIENEISNNDVVIFSKSYCPFCSATKETFNQVTTNDKIKVIELDIMFNGEQIQKELKKMTGQRTVPCVFVKGKHIGGNDDTQMLAESGKLQKLLASTKSMSINEKMHGSSIDDTAVTVDSGSELEA